MPPCLRRTLQLNVPAAEAASKFIRLMSRLKAVPYKDTSLPAGNGGGRYNCKILPASSDFVEAAPVRILGPERAHSPLGSPDYRAYSSIDRARAGMLTWACLGRGAEAISSWAGVPRGFGGLGERGSRIFRRSFPRQRR